MTVDEKPAPRPRWKPKGPLPPLAPGEVRLLTGGNPQVPKGDGDGPVQAYIAAMPGWKRGVGEAIDALAAAHLPDVQKAVRWNSPFWGIAGQGWFMNIGCVAAYVKVAFFRGTSLQPMPPVASKVDQLRYLHVFEHKGLDEAQFADWLKQAGRTGGAAMF